MSSQPENDEASGEVCDTATPEPPGALRFPAELRRRLTELAAARHSDDPARTRHLRPDGLPCFTNRLALESSPYLRQHAHNPVNWFPWGDEAFDLAAETGRPVFLSVGYSTCHWCHVMEEESFEDLEIAEYLNTNYVAVKVDREQRPDVDGLYMTAVQYFNGGRGGWPMTVIMRSDRVPFFGATYIPARDGDRGAGMGLLSVLRRLRDLHEAEPDDVAAAADRVAQVIAAETRPERPGGVPSSQAIANAARRYMLSYDEVYGGLSGQMKFPTPSVYRLLLRYHRRSGSSRALDIVTTTLERMANGGIYDQLAGGFHRYATDAQWLVPHFEKMLYDNAQLASLYLEGFQATGRTDFARIARETLDYVSREMTSDQGGFYSATDADSEGEEGLFFVWSLDEISALLDEEQRAVIVAHYGVTDRGNFEGANILHVGQSLDQVAADLSLSVERVRELLHEGRTRLLRARQGRVPPGLDDKILTSWNGLMISAFAQGALVLDEPAYLARARGSAQFVFDNLWRDDRLYRSYRDGQVEALGFLDDYAFLEAGLLDLYETTGEALWLERAIVLQRVLDEHFADAAHGGYFLTSDEHEDLFARAKPDYDGAEPTGNSVAAENLLRLAELTTDPTYRTKAEQVFAAFSETLVQRSTSLPRMLSALDFYLDEPREIVLVRPEGEGGDVTPFLSELRSVFFPNRVVVIVREGDELNRLQSIVPLVENKLAQGGRATAYVCQAGTCERPTVDADIFARQIEAVTPYE